MRPRQKQIADLESDLGAAVSRLGEVRARVDRDVAAERELADAARAHVELVAYSAAALAVTGEALASARADILSELAAIDARIALRDRQAAELPERAAEARSALEEAERNLDAARAKDRPLVERLEKQIAKLQRRIATARAYQPRFTVLLPGGGAEETKT